jgi:8-oxo-dGTP pyrophosphatase MutT (NUDIX family)
MICGFQRDWPSQELRAGVLPFRRTAGEGVEFLLIRHQNHRFWSVPKGQLMAGRTPCETAAIEAYEEAGVSGRISPTALGSYLHAKSSRRAGDWAHVVEVVLFPLEVDEILVRWPEMALRERRWVRPQEGVELVAPGQLRKILADFRPDRVMESELTVAERA